MDNYFEFSIHSFLGANLDSLGRAIKVVLELCYYNRKIDTTIIVLFYEKK